MLVVYYLSKIEKRHGVYVAIVTVSPWISSK
jgi:hypothetical protein